MFGNNIQQLIQGKPMHIISNELRLYLQKFCETILRGGRLLSLSLCVLYLVKTLSKEYPLETSSMFGTSSDDTTQIHYPSEVSVVVDKLTTLACNQ